MYQITIVKYAHEAPRVDTRGINEYGGAESLRSRSSIHPQLHKSWSSAKGDKAHYWQNERAHASLALYMRV